ncbi:unnamed protein product [Tuber melanosporum]|uniref:(Perigord truffle) hypothetical protein n=1 Tax=Tuber melanosporum (strain Mel28) TaxID=656061 RepID=D5GE91_TUBMM|nr:uncharacterized protein GSTUM_00001228001 [Tuber melanosporum]CAZ82834.1 unnamed protein product [Tuber melanosporum]
MGIRSSHSLVSTYPIGTRSPEPPPLDPPLLCISTESMDGISKVISSSAPNSADKPRYFRRFPFLHNPPVKGTGAVVITSPGCMGSGINPVLVTGQLATSKLGFFLLGLFVVRSHKDCPLVYNT